ncbi:MAG: hypothetical protein ACJ8AW_07220 [Rhodopila sp.]
MWPLLLVLSLASPVLAAAPEINWQEAVARLAQERTQAETCARLLKKYGDDAAKDRGELAYSQAKAEYDGIIAGLVVALAQKKQPDSLKDLQDRLQHGFAKREAFCQSAQSLVPSQSGEKGALDEIVKGAVGPLIDAIKEIYLDAEKQGAQTRETIQTQLEATSWPTFSAVSSSS